MKLPLIVQVFHWPTWPFILCAIISSRPASAILSRKFCSIPSTKPVWCLSPLYPQNTLCDFSWDNHHLPCSIFRHSPVHKKYPQQLQFTDLVVLPVEFNDKEVQRHGESCCSRGSLLGETGDGSGKSRLGFAWNEWGVGKVLSTIISIVSGCLSLVWHIVHIMNTLGSCTK